MCATDPDTDRVIEALEACPLVISQELFLSETARHADVVLPAASWLEKDGTFVNFDRRFQRVRPALVPPGQARTDFAIVHAIAAAYGADLGCPTPAEALAECGRVAPMFAGMSHQRLDREGAIPWPCPDPEQPGQAKLYLGGFATPDGLARLAARHAVRDGDTVLVESRHGQTTFPTRITEEVTQGQLFCTFHFSSSRANALTSDH
ncbi:molybdopterin oxidoreductase family protein, partial [Nonomuraea jabiensis]|uniref:molybdopterin oxidoreductase family protein n=1 Tax=Nonomuraea jabiensis TaxID=882448 RepID=UPI003D718E78